MVLLPLLLSFFFFNDTATTEIYSLSLHDALPICVAAEVTAVRAARARDEEAEVARRGRVHGAVASPGWAILVGRRSEEHTSELQSRQYLVCRLLLEKKKKTYQEYRLRRRRLVHYT